MIVIGSLYVARPYGDPFEERRPRVRILDVKTNAEGVEWVKYESLGDDDKPLALLSPWTIDVASFLRMFDPVRVDSTPPASVAELKTYRG